MALAIHLLCRCLTLTNRRTARPDGWWMGGKQTKQQLSHAWTWRKIVLTRNGEIFPKHGLIRLNYRKAFTYRIVGEFNGVLAERGRFSWVFCLCCRGGTELAHDLFQLADHTNVLLCMLFNSFMVIWFRTCSFGRIKCLFHRGSFFWVLSSVTVVSPAFPSLRVISNIF